MRGFRKCKYAQSFGEALADMHAQFVLDDYFVSELDMVDITTEHAAPKVQTTDHTVKHITIFSLRSIEDKIYPRLPNLP